MPPRKEGFVGTDVFTGGTRILVPGLFLAETYLNEAAKLKFQMVLGGPTLDNYSQLIIQNNINLRAAVGYREIDQFRVSNKISEKHRRYILAGNQEKAANLLMGYATSILHNRGTNTNSELEEYGELRVGKREKWEWEDVQGFAYLHGDKEIINIPYNLFATIDKAGKITPNLDPNFLSASGRTVLEYAEKLNVRTFTVNRGALGKLERLCHTNQQRKRDKLIRRLIQTIRFSLAEAERMSKEEDEGDGNKIPSST